MRSYSASKVVSRLFSVLVLSGILFGFVGLPWPVVRAQDSEEGQIAYIGKDGNLWLMNMDGSNQAQLTRLTEDKVWLYTWSPDGRRIAFLGEVSHRLYVVTVADMSLHQVAGIERIHQFVWSPNGEMLAIVTGGGSWGDDNRILLVELANWEIREVADGYAVQWALDGRQLLYVSNYREVEEPLQEIRVVSTDGDVHIVVEAREWGTSWPIETLTLSLNGAWIAVYVSGLEFEGTLWTLRTDGSELRQIVEYIQPNQFDWSPDGDWLVYRDSGDPFRTGEGGGLALTNVVTGETIMFSPDREWGDGVSFDTNPVWTPDGASIISCSWSFVPGVGSKADGLIVMMGADVLMGTGIQGAEPVFIALSEECPTAHPEQVWVGGLAVSWSPDGQYLAVEEEGRICVDHFGCVADGHFPAWRPLVTGPTVGETGPDLGFRPNPNGYHFQNDQFLRTQEMFEQFFGTENVRHPDGSWCEAAMQFFWGTHPDMPQPWKGKGYRNVADGWSCVGFSLSSLLSYLDQPQPQAGPFAIAHYEQLYRHTEPDQFTASIAYYSGVQTGKQYVDAFRARMDHCDTDPNRKIDDIEEGILNRKPVIVLLNTFTDLGYHALVPYRVESVSSTETNIYVYDSEAPGEEHVIHFAHSGDEWHWTYTFVGSIAKAAGTATGRCEDIFLYPIRTSVEQGDPPVVFCESQSATSGVKALQRSDRSHRVLAQLPAEGDWVMRDNLGRRLGWVNGVLVSEIPDAFYVPQALGDVSLSYRILYLPEGEYTVELTDSPTDEFGYTLFGDGRFIEVAGHLRSPGSGVGLSITPGLDQARLSETQNLTSFTLTLDSERTTESRVATVAGASLTGSGDLSVDFDGDQLMVSRGGGNLHYSLGLEKSDGQHFASEPLTLEGNETHALSPTNWTELESASVVWEIDDDSDGTIDETLVLEDRASVPVPTPTATVSPENGKGKGPCPGSLAMIGLVGLATLIGLTGQSPQSRRRR